MESVRFKIENRKFLIKGEFIIVFLGYNLLVLYGVIIYWLCCGIYWYIYYFGKIEGLKDRIKVFIIFTIRVNLEKYDNFFKIISFAFY